MSPDLGEVAFCREMWCLLAHSLLATRASFSRSVPSVGCVHLSFLVGPSAASTLVVKTGPQPGWLWGPALCGCSGCALGWGRPLAWLVVRPTSMWLFRMLVGRAGSQHAWIRGLVVCDWCGHPGGQDRLLVWLIVWLDSVWLLQLHSFAVIVTSANRLEEGCLPVLPFQRGRMRSQNWMPSASQSLVRWGEFHLSLAWEAF